MSGIIVDVCLKYCVCYLLNVLNCCDSVFSVVMLYTCIVLFLNLSAASLLYYLRWLVINCIRQWIIIGQHMKYRWLHHTQNMTRKYSDYSLYHYSSWRSLYCDHFFHSNLWIRQSLELTNFAILIFLKFQYS